MEAGGFGTLLREWRRTRRLSQGDLAEAAEVSARHISFLETGRSTPSRSMVLVLASALDMPLRDRNLLLQAAGFASVYQDSAPGPPASGPLRRTLDLLLRHHEPYPAIAVTTGWDLVDMNPSAAGVFMRFIADPSEPLVARNVMHAVFHPQGLRPSIVNWDDVSAALIDRLHRDAMMERERGESRELLDALAEYPDVPGRFDAIDVASAPEICVPVHVKRDQTELRFFTTITSLGTPIDAAAQELRIEAYFPADDATEQWLREGSRDD